MSEEESRAEKIKKAGVKRFGSEAAWREFLRQSSAKSARNTVGTGGFNYLKRTDPERLKEISKRGGRNGRTKQL